MKRSITSGLITAGVLGLGLAAADVKLDSNLTIKGFLDMSTSGGYINDPGKWLSPVAEEDQFEVDFLYKYGEHISAEADIAQGGLGGGTGGNVGLESGWVTYTQGATSISAGRFLSVSGWEAAEPTSTYQYSYNDAITAYGVYENGVNLAYKADKYALYGAFVTSVWNNGVTAMNTDNSLRKPGFEAQLALMPTSAITIKATDMGEDMADTTAGGSNYLKDVVNVWASYAAGPITAAIEYDGMSNFLGNTSKWGNGGLVMANYKLSSKVVATVRYSFMQPDPRVKMQDEVTFSPTYSFADNWWVLGEVRQEIAAKVTTYGVETTMTF